ncbi:NAD-dependent epimerase/dehydratase family protein [Maribacter sp. MAR_2009_72]|uniref:NAD-dependent epimerase/dehydratase family protein n=1 Tax=Maribacter sp. MAR_2009_72 TaxID=1250050 RepID=UPI001199AEDE|nr:NAD-dependent epimerase/dehydratase family protein [Maribacter sp. MAR_2009_72]TVZ16436.1 nucleoside-diphosphate-sugar epimerase [Maribacter sp. MAR_2009_72]
MTTKIGIIGCGWLGLPLATSLIGKGHVVKGTTTSKDKLELLKKNGIEPFPITLTENNIQGPIEDFLHTITTLIIDVPPKLRGKGPKESYIAKIQLLHEAIKKSSVQNIIFTSSTAVYGDVEGMVNEKSLPVPNTSSGKQLVQCEQLFKNDSSLKTTIIRFGGLIGPGRHPITMLAGKQNLNGGTAPVNLIHLDDCIGIIETIIETDHFGDTINAVYPEHPTKQDYYTQEAIKRNLPLPHYTQTLGKTYKKVESCSIFLINNYDFLTTIN